MSSSINSAPPMSPMRASPEEPTAELAGKQLEAFFLRRMLAEMRATVGDGMFSGGYSTEMFQNMLDEAMADEMSESGGLGIAEVISKELADKELAGGEVSSNLQSAFSQVPMALPDSINATSRGSQELSSTATPPVGSTIGVQRASRAYKAHSHELRTMPIDDARVSSKFGRRIHPVTGAKSFHEGIDLAAKAGTKVGVSGPGIVIRAGKAGSYGNLVVVDHGGGLETRYAHLQSIGVKVGQQLATGESVGKVGATGRVTGPHLHFEVRRGGKAINPNNILENGAKSTDSSQGRAKADDR